MTTVTFKNGQSIEFTGYKSALSHRNQILNIAKDRNIQHEIGNATTGSYYIEMFNDKFDLSARFSNHTKPDTDTNIVIKESYGDNGHLYIEISVLSMADFKAAKSYIKELTK